MVPKAVDPQLDSGANIVPEFYSLISCFRLFDHGSRIMRRNKCQSNRTHDVTRNPSMRRYRAAAWLSVRGGDRWLACVESCRASSPELLFAVSHPGWSALPAHAYLNSSGINATTVLRLQLVPRIGCLKNSAWHIHEHGSQSFR
jgi:hypothetical protein